MSILNEQWTLHVSDAWAPWCYYLVEKRSSTRNVPCSRVRRYKMIDNNTACDDGSAPRVISMAISTEAPSDAVSLCSFSRAVVMCIGRCWWTGTACYYQGETSHAWTISGTHTDCLFNGLRRWTRDLWWTRSILYGSAPSVIIMGIFTDALIILLVHQKILVGNHCVWRPISLYRQPHTNTWQFLPTQWEWPSCIQVAFWQSPEVP